MTGFLVDPATGKKRLATRRALLAAKGLRVCCSAPKVGGVKYHGDGTPVTYCANCLRDMSSEVAP